MPSSFVFDTPGFLQALVTRVRTFVSPRGGCVGVLCVDRVYIRTAPDNVAKPYLVLTVDGGESDEEYANLKRGVLITVLGVSDDPQEAELVADLGEAALLTWRHSSPAEGLMYGVRSSRDTTEPNDPATRDRCETKVTVAMAAWMQPFTSAA